MRHGKAVVWPFLILSLLAFGGALAYRWAERRGVFDLDVIRIRGASPADSTVVACLVAPLFGTPLGSVDIDGLRRNLEEVSFIRKAEVKRRWPSTVVVDLQTETAAVLLAVGDRMVPLTECCQPLPPDHLCDSLPVLEVRERIEPDVLSEIVPWMGLGRLPAEEVQDAFVDDRGLTVRLRSGVSVLVGRSNLDKRWKFYRSVPPSLVRTAEGGCVDMRFKNQAVFDLRSEEGS
ncbi:FtsQ-type POTRA domain-containing protein [Candidatus Fermentibacteria bacterium]|nr:FtsQ-type POTRA domain-containing protein [Candidatus Fermentibacteria bacterium]